MFNATHHGKGIAAELSAFDDVLRELFEATPLFLLITEVRRARAAHRR